MASTQQDPLLSSNGNSSPVAANKGDGVEPNGPISSWSPACMFSFPNSFSTWFHRLTLFRGLIAWKTKPVKQDVVYQDQAAVDQAISKLQRLPPLVTPTEVSVRLGMLPSSADLLKICQLKRSLREVALGKAFLLQGGKALSSLMWDHRS